MRALLIAFASAALLSSLARPAEAVDPAPAASPATVSTATPSPAPKKRYDPNLALIGGSADVVVKTARYYDTSDDNGNSSAQEIAVVTFVWTNDTGLEVAPRIDRFEFVDASGQISTGVDSGYTALVGISNSLATLKRGEAHTYTVGFLVPQGDAGQIIYDSSK